MSPFSHCFLFPLILVSIPLFSNAIIMRTRKQIMDINAVLADQLKKTCKLTGVRWATWLQRTEKGWDFSLNCALSKTRQGGLAHFIQLPETAAWLAGALSSDRVRSRATGELATRLGCQRVYVFANLKAQFAILVGANQLTREAQAFFHVLSLNCPSTPAAYRLPLAHQVLALPFEIDPEVSYDLQTVLNWVLEIITGVVECKAAFIAIRAGEMFRVEASWNYASSVRGFEIPLLEYDTLSEMVSTRQGVVLGGPVELPAFIIDSALQQPAKSAMALPIVIGRRVIGLLVMVSFNSNDFRASHLKQGALYLDHVAHRIENAIVFADVSRYLQQFALLNELASAAASGTDTDEVARRVMHTLCRVFHTDKVAVLLLTSDGKMLREYGSDRKPNPIMIPVETSLAGYVVETRKPVRFGDVRQAPRYIEEYPGVRSAMDVPLIYRGKVIGTIAVRSTENNAFTSQDERLIAVIASHLAGLLENVRLYEETRERARNLDLIHKVVERVVRLTVEAEIAQVAAELVAEYFGYEFVVVMVADEAGQNLLHMGVGGTMSHLIQRGQYLPVGKGIMGRVFATGEGCYLNDVSCHLDYVPINGWQAGSEMCVPLWDGDQVFGLLNLERAQNHAFSETDKMLFVSLAGILSSVMMNARRYQELQRSVRHLQAARETALDISGDLDLDALFKRVVHRACELARAKGAVLALVEEKQQVIRIMAAEFPWLSEYDRVIPLRSGLIGQAAACGEPLIVVDYRSWDGRLYPDIDIPLSTVAAVPLKWKGEVMGVIAIADDEPGRIFQPDEVQLLELLAPQVAVSIRNARLYQELEERIGAQRLAEKRLLHSARLAALGEMAAGVAHELNNPLTTVAGFVELALEELPDDLPQHAELTLVLSEARRAQTVVRRLLDFARQSENIRMLNDLNNIVSEVIALVQHQILTGGVQLQVELDRNLPLILVDPNQVKQVLLNLIQNALQAMPEGGSLLIKTALQIKAEAKSWVMVSVRDTGVGIPSENLDRIYEPFFTTRQIGKGTGLGLSVSYGLISDHGGHIDVESVIGKGSCFTIWLPVLSGQNDV